MVWGALIGAGATLLAGERRNRQQTSAANAQMNFQRELSNTGYQRAMEDMRSAGINPILAGKLGPASTPGGAMPLLHDTVSPAINSGLSIAQAEADLDIKDEQVRRIQQEVSSMQAAQNLTEHQTNRISHEIAQIEAQIDLVENQAIQSSTASELQAQQAKGQMHDNVQKEILAEFYDSANIARIAKDIGINPSTLKSIINLFFRGKN
jgi:transposase-like protein